MEKYDTARQATDDNTKTRRTRFARWISKATDTHSGYVTHIASPRQQWVHERGLMLRLYVHCQSYYNSDGMRSLRGTS